MSGLTGSSGTKTYAVEYLIQTNATTAVQGVTELAAAVEKLCEPMTIASEKASALYKTLTEINSVQPNLNIRAFEQQVDQMVTYVNNAANKMRTAISNAMAGNPVGTKAIKGAAKKAFTSNYTKAAIEDELKRVNQEIKKFESANGILASAQKKGAKLSAENKARYDALLRERAVYQQRLDSGDYLTNVTPQTIKTWHKFFGNSKSKSLKVKITADGTKAINEINTVKEALDGLSALGKFTIAPRFAEQSFLAVENRLRQLAQLSKMVVAPFQDQRRSSYSGFINNEDKNKIKDAQTRIQSLGQSLKKWKSTLAEKQAIPEDKRTRYDKGAITSTSNKIKAAEEQIAKEKGLIQSIRSKAKNDYVLNNKGQQPKTLPIDVVGTLTKIATPATPITVPVGISIIEGSAQSAVSALKPPTLTVNAKLAQSSLKTLQKQLGTSTGTTDKKGKDKNVAASTAKTKSAVSASSAASKSKASKNPTIALELDTTAALGKLNAFIETIKSSSPQTIALTASGSTAKPATTSVTGTSSKNTVSTSSAKTGGTVQGSKPQTGSAVQQPLNLRRYRDNIGAHLAQKTVLPANFGSMAVQQVRWSNLQRVAEMDNAAAAFSAAGFTPYMPKHLLPKERYKKQKNNALNNHLKQLKDNRFRSRKAQEYTSQQQAWHDQQQRMYNRLFGAIPQGDPGWAERAEMRRGAELANMRRDAMIAYANPTPYEEAEAAKKLAQQQKVAAPAGMFGSGKNMVSFGKAMPAAELAPTGYHWEKSKGLVKHLDNSQKNKYSKALTMKDEAWQKLVATHQATQPYLNGTRITSNPMIERLTSIHSTASSISSQRLAEFGNAVNQLDAYKSRFAELQSQAGALEAEKQALIARKSLNANHAARLTQIVNMQREMAALPALIDQQQAIVQRADQSHAVASQRSTAIRNRLDSEKSAQSANDRQKALSQRREARASYKTQRDNVRGYSRGYKLMPNVAEETTAPVVAQTSKVSNSGSRRTPSSKAIPVTSVDNRSFYDRSKKWAYPLTGNTSFGARTPMGVEMAKGMGVMFAIQGAMSAIGGSFSQAMEYQNTMQTAKSILQNGTSTYSDDRFKNMQETVREIGVKTKFSAPEVANATKFLAMAGFDIDDINTAIRPIADLALIGDNDLGEVADKMTNIMSTFGLKGDMLKQHPEKVRQFANIMATTATRTNTDLMMLAESAKYGGGVANMYGHNDPNIFADTMAMFGIMGNSGIQASSAGTALRMMYQNIFNPNNKQAKILKSLEKRGVRIKGADGNNRSMADIIIDIANKVPDNEMAEIVGQLFRITAQPGANAAIMSAKDIALEATGGDANTALALVDETNNFVDKMSGKDSKVKMSQLAELIQANRNSMNGNISGVLAEDKQNTMKGLWAQVTSMFTEGIVQAFEQRQGGIKEMLEGLRDYFAKPETIRMLHNLLDMVIEIGKVMAWFVKIWASLYNLCPGLIKTWVITQMFFTQIGSLINPFIQLIGVLSRLGNTIFGFNAMSAASGIGGTVAGMISGRSGSAVTGRIVKGSAGSYAAMSAAPLFVGYSHSNKKQFIKGSAAQRARQAMMNNAVLVGSMALGAGAESKLSTLNKATLNHHNEIYKRARSIYGVGRFGSAFNEAAYMAPFGITKKWIKSATLNLLGGIGRALGTIFNPFTIATAAVVAFGAATYSAIRRLRGVTDEQEAAKVKRAKAAKIANETISANSKWYRDEMGKFKHTPQTVSAYQKTEQEIKYDEETNNFRKSYEDIRNDLSQGASLQNNESQVKEWKKRIDNNPLMKLAFTEKAYNKYVSGVDDPYEAAKDMHDYMYSSPVDESSFSVLGYLSFLAPKNRASNIQSRQIQGALRTAGVNSPIIQAAAKEIAELRQKYLSGKISQEQYLTDATAIRDQYVNFQGRKANLKSSDGMTLKEFNSISDPSNYYQYVLGQHNVLTNIINGAEGTVVGKMNAHYNLRHKLYEKIDQLQGAVHEVLDDYPVIFQAIDPKGMVQNIEVTLSTLPNGNINTAAIVEQIKQKCNNYTGCLKDFMAMYARILKAMADSKDLDPENIPGLLKGAVGGFSVSESDALSYYKNLPNNNLIKKTLSAEEFVKQALAPAGTMIKYGNNKERTVGSWTVRKWIRENSMQQVLDGLDKLTESTNPSDKSQEDKTTPTNAPVKDQLAYASHYDKGSAKVQQVNINVGTIASFDRTSISSSAEERDLIDAMQPMVAQAVYEMWATAVNQAQSSFIG